MRTHYDLVILGATALGCGIAGAWRGKAVAVIENGCTAAPEFAAALYTDGHAADAPDSALKSELLARKALDTDGEWLPALSPVTASLLRESRADCYFFSALSGIVTCPEGYRVSFCSYGVTSVVTASRIIDTTSRFISRMFFDEQGPSCVFSLRWFDASRSLRSLPCDDDILSAREELARIAETEPVFLTAPVLSVVPSEKERRIGGAVLWEPSSAYGNAPAAYAKGMSLTPGSAFSCCPSATARPLVPVDAGEFDIITVGMGTAGAVCALTAAGEGMRVLGTEAQEAMGGAATLGGVLGYYMGIKGGMYTAVDDEAEALAESFAGCGARSPDRKITVLDRRIRNAGVTLRYNAALTGVLHDGNTVTGIRWTENGVSYQAHARFVIDCTAESSVCVAAGCKMQGGRKLDGIFQPFSGVYYFCDGNGRLRAGYTDNGTVNQYDPDDFGRNILSAACHSMHLYSDYSSRSYFGTVPYIGLREGLKIVGEENIAFAKMIEGDFCREPLYYGRSNLDNHGRDSVFEDRVYQDWMTLCGLWGFIISFPIPRGALIPKGWQGLLAAGRNIAIDHTGAMAVRMKDDCQKSGEAAAVLASLALHRGEDVRDVPYALLRERLSATGCLKPEDRIRVEDPAADAPYDEPLWLDDDERLTALLSGDAPGYAMWSAAALKKCGLLHRLVASGNRNARFHSALALALTGDDTDDTVDALTEAAAETDGFIPRVSRSYVHYRSVSAVCALGRIGAVKAVPMLKDLLLSDSFADTLPLPHTGIMRDREDVRFQYRTHCIAALCGIAEKHPDQRDAIRDFLRGYICGKEFSVSLWASPDLSADRTDSVRMLVGTLG